MTSTSEIEVEVIKLPQAAADLLIPDSLVLTTMFEDWALDTYESTRCDAEWIIRNSNGAFVLIEAGAGLIVPPCCHASCETYEALYSLILVPTSVWNEKEVKVLERSLEWRNQANTCKQA